MNTLVIHCHPDPDSFTSAVRERVLAALATARHDVRLTDLYAEDFDPVLGAEEHRRHRQPGADATVTQHADDLAWAQQLVLVYPTWWSGQPAMLKGWIDRVWVCGVAWDLPHGSSRVRGRLHGMRRIVAVTTHGSSKFVNAVEGEIGKRALKRTLRPLCGRRARVRWVAMYGIDTAPATKRAAFLERVTRSLSR